MRTLLLILIFVVLLSANVVFAGIVIDCPYPNTKKIDGLLDDWDVNSFTHIPHDKGPLKGRDDRDISCDFATAADDKYLYVAAIISDDKLIYGKINDYTEDSLEIYIDANNKKTRYYEKDDAQIGIPAINIGLHNISNPRLYSFGGGKNTGTRVAAVRSKNGWIVEAAIPFSNANWKIKPAVGKSIGFNLQVNDNDRNKGRDHQLVWSDLDTNNESWQSTAVFGKLVFTEKKLKK
ncbi:MAG: sugar-binding protein [Candidatus Omnitrophota bacterium]